MKENREKLDRLTNSLSQRALINLYYFLLAYNAGKMPYVFETLFLFFHTSTTNN